MPVAGDTGGNSNRTNSVTHILSYKTPLFHLKLYALISILVVLLLLLSFTIFLCLRLSRNARKRKVKHSSGLIPPVSKEILEIKALNQNADCFAEEGNIGNSAPSKSSEGISDDVSGASDVSAADAQNIGWGRWYSLKELEMATRGFAEENVVGEGGYGVVFRGVLQDGSVVAVKSLLNNKGQAEKEFNVEVEAIGKVRHKNLVGLVGYCTEGPQRILVYEYVDNGTWNNGCTVMLVLLAYLHEGLEPKVVHRDVKSSNILLDKNYVSPEYASTGMLNEGSDVYSFGVLLMEIITGRSPIDYSREPGEMNLVDWFKGMVACRRGEELVDPLIEIVHMLEADDFPFRSEHRPAAREGYSVPSTVPISSRVPHPKKHIDKVDATKSRRK
ncbi:putative receptor-like serine/threonine-protein kinase [Hibiscus syriacus]|uniref:non-specific serine/threonine protein kinase n=1 Tax=Hibiscus syriacus TaxID=106335 RepID=A0A6A2XC25_HIBSY|nr:putative receptor-like serine/threonine-protein kinase [Hibiscus syriacus]